MLASLNTGAQLRAAISNANPQDHSTTVDVNNVHFSWSKETSPTLTIRRFTVKQGEKLFLEGPSGCGKSTFLSLLAGINKVAAGTVSILGNQLENMNGAERDSFRADHIGLIFQMFNLLSYLSVIENVTLPCMFSKHRKKRALENSENIKTEAMRILTRLELSDPAIVKRPVMELSVGQQQRVAAARALMGRPELIICDEPTSSLDQVNRESFLKLLFEECEKSGSSLIFASHDTLLAPQFDRAITFDEINVGRDTSCTTKREVQ
ncbi:MAG: ABC transporter ATP-binding protein [Desulforhopalus sp.]